MRFGDFKMGDKSPGVADLQKYLVSVGFRIGVDGVFGANTRAAVISFQKQRRIAVDGIAGPGTMIEMAKAIGEGWKTSAPAVASPVAPISNPGAPYIPGNSPIMASAGGPSSMTGLLILVGLAVAVWIFTKGKASV
jgi:peptidoglycan hydrolase-like protein with peptidoglycan-binding domain